MDNEMQIFNKGTFQFSGARLDNLETSNNTLVAIVLDSSASIAARVPELREALKEVVRSCQKSPRSDNLMIRVVDFSTKVNEFHGFKELNKCDLSTYDTLLNHLGGSTSLYDAVVNSVESVSKYGSELYENDYGDTNAIVVVLTDGQDNNSTETINSVKNALANAVGEKKLESLVSILIGVDTGLGFGNVGQSLKSFAQDAGFTQYVDIKDANAKELARLAQFISKSITSVSTSLLSGTAPTSLKF